MADLCNTPWMAELMYQLPVLCWFIALSDGIRMDEKTGSVPWPNLKTVSFKHFQDEHDEKDQMGLKKAKLSLQFMNLMAQCHSKEIKMEMVHADWLSAGFISSTPPEIGLAIVSIKNIHPGIFYFSLDNLELLDLIVSRCCVHATSQRFGTLVPDRIMPLTRPEWPKLKAVSILVDSLIMRHATGVTNSETGAEPIILYYQLMLAHLIFKFLFDGVESPNLQRLSIDITEPKFLPKAEVVKWIVSSCVNLTHLEISNWTGTNKSITILWRGLGNLRQVKFRNCPCLGNVAFVGKDPQRPDFLLLKKLEKLSLLQLDSMPKLTDTLFQAVLSKCHLSELILSSDKPLESVTKAGIMALLEGPFAQSIVKFPFHRWSLSNCSGDEFTHISKQFRSYFM